MPSVVARLNPTRPYRPSSPHGREDFNSELSGDRHQWYVSIGAPTLQERIDYALYAADRGKFISEFGVIAPPHLESMQRWLPHGELERGSAVWKLHSNRFERGTNDAALERYWKSPRDMTLREYVHAAQAIQAEALKFAIEHWRRRKFRTAGALFWMFADCWGEIGWTVIDYCLGRKPSYYAVKRAFSHVLVSLERKGDCVVVHLINDLPQAVGGELTCGWLNVRTGDLSSQAFLAHVAPNSAAEIFSLPLPGQPEEAWMAFAQLKSGGEILSFNRCFLAGFNFNTVGFPPANVQCKAVDGAALEVWTDAFAWHVHVDVLRGVWLEDNDFDLLPGQKRQIRAIGPQELLARAKATALNSPPGR